MNQMKLFSSHFLPILDFFTSKIYIFKERRIDARKWKSTYSNFKNLCRNFKNLIVVYTYSNESTFQFPLNHKFLWSRRRLTIKYFNVTD